MTPIHPDQLGRNTMNTEKSKPLGEQELITRLRDMLTKAGHDVSRLSDKDILGLAEEAAAELKGEPK